MTKRTGHIESNAVDDGLGELIQETIHPKGVIATFEHGGVGTSLDEALQRLVDSGIVTVTDNAITWRTGHLEHVARLYAADPKLAWRDYADDLTVALAADGSNFAAAVEAARGEVE